MQSLSSLSLHLCPLINPNPNTKFSGRFRAQPLNFAREALPDKTSYLPQGYAKSGAAASSAIDLVTCFGLDKHAVRQDQISSFPKGISLSATLEELELQLEKTMYEVCPKHVALASFQQKCIAESFRKVVNLVNGADMRKEIFWISTFFIGQISVLPAQVALADEIIKADALYEIAEFFELGIQLSYLLSLLALIGVGTFFVIRQVLARRELDLSAKELQEQVRSGDASATEYFELGAVMLRRKFYPAATKYFLQAIEKWDGDDQDLSQVYNALGVSYVRDGKLDKALVQFENAVKLQPGYVTAWNNLGDSYEKKKEYKSALKAFEEALLFDPNNKVARPRRDALKERVQMYKGVSIKTAKKR